MWHSHLSKSVPRQTVIVCRIYCTLIRPLNLLKECVHCERFKQDVVNDKTTKSNKKREVTKTHEVISMVVYHIIIYI